MSMVIRYSFKLLGFIYLILTSSVVWCFNEPCTNDRPCSSQDLICRGGYCLCSSNQFWAGDKMRCIECPTRWFNLLIMCVYYEPKRMLWSNAQTECDHMGIIAGRTIRLLELHDLSEFYFIRKHIKWILTIDRMQIEMEDDSGILKSVTAFVGSQGRRFVGDQWTYNWGDQNNWIYAKDSEMWCPKKYWGSTMFPAEPAWEQNSMADWTYQALKRWSDSNGTCLVSLLPTDEHSFICEIAGESGRLQNISTSAFFHITTASTSSSTVTEKFSTTSSSTTSRQSAILTTQTSSQQLPTSTSINSSQVLISTSNIPTDLTSFPMATYAPLSSASSFWSNRKQALLIIAGGIAFVLLTNAIIVIVKMRHRNQQQSSAKSDNNPKRKSRKIPSNNEERIDDIQSTSSPDSHLSDASTAKRSEDSRSTANNDDYRPLPSFNRFQIAKTNKRALWDQMESSLFTSN